MNSNNLSIAVEFDLSGVSNVFNVTDTTNYASITATDKLGNVRVLAPSGVQIHNNVSYGSPDIDVNSSTTSADFPLTILADGTYTLIYTVKLVNELQSIAIASNDSAAKTFTLAGNYVTMINDGTATAFNCVDTVTTALTIVSATYSSGTGLTTVTVGETLGLLTPNALFQFTVDTIATKTFSQAYAYTEPDVCLNWEADDCCSSMTITDVTTYPTGSTVTRLHTVSYPDGMVTPIADIASPLQELTISPIWTGTWTDVFTADIEVVIGIITVIDKLRGVKEFRVSADTHSCQVYACYKAISAKYADQLVTAPTLAAKTASWLILATSALSGYNLAKKCGKPQADLDSFLSQITAIADTCGCSCDCENCADDTPTQVVGCCENVGGSDFTIVVQNLDGSITVSAVTVGTTTTFTISVTGSWLTTQINNILAVTSIDALSDVDTSTVPPTNGQALIWNTTNWVPGSIAQTLVGLTDVNDTGLADKMIMYYDFGTLTFKFRLNTVANLNDVTLTGIANKDILQWNGSAWVNVDNFLSLLTDVNTTGILDDSALKWDTATSKWIIYQPKLTLASLDDVDLTFFAPLADYDMLVYYTGTGWTNLARPAFATVSNADFQAGYDNQVPGECPVQLMYDPTENSVTLRGVIDNAVGVSVGSTLIMTISKVAWRPPYPTRFPCVVNVGLSAGLTGFVAIDAVGQIFVDQYLDAAGAVTGGHPNGDIDFGPGVKWYL